VIRAYVSIAIDPRVSHQVESNPPTSSGLYTAVGPLSNRGLDGVAVVSDIAASRTLRESASSLYQAVSTYHSSPSSSLQDTEVTTSVFASTSVLLSMLREWAPLIHHITNKVVMNRQSVDGHGTGENGGHSVMYYNLIIKTLGYNHYWIFRQWQRWRSIEEIYEGRRKGQGRGRRDLGALLIPRTFCIIAISYGRLPGFLDSGTVSMSREEGLDTIGQTGTTFI
jgi:hypothetical protein